jgi:2-keto-4-pentenoate hydratase/2-oxohepta-3-ene-1,7-dioic acid hydratase in catechol pathway
MRIARGITYDGRTLTGRVTSGRWIEPVPDELPPAMRAGLGPLATQPLELERLLAPIDPPNIIAIGRNYRAHAAETGSAVPASPLIFLKPTSSLSHPDAPIILPAEAPREIDFEAELAIVIGRTARRVGEARAFEYVLGFTCANDVSARDCQRADKQWSRAKGFDTFCPLGPWLVTPDEIDPDRCAIRSRLNGSVMQAASTDQMIHACRRLVAYVSDQFTLRPGTVILTGTPEGVGMARAPAVFLRPGDVIEIEIEGIGTLRNPVIADAAAPDAGAPEQRAQPGAAR